MKPVLAVFRVKKTSAEVTEIPVVDAKVQGKVTQAGATTFGVGPDGQNLVHSIMTLEAFVIAEATGVTLLKAHSEVEAIFIEAEPTVAETTPPEEAKQAGNYYAAHLYPHAISHLNRMFQEMGFGAVQLNQRYPGTF